MKELGTTQVRKKHNGRMSTMCHCCCSTCLAVFTILRHVMVNQSLTAIMLISHLMDTISLAERIGNPAILHSAMDQPHQQSKQNNSSFLEDWHVSKITEDFLFQMQAFGNAFEKFNIRSLIELRGCYSLGILPLPEAPEHRQNSIKNPAPRRRSCFPLRDNRPDRGQHDPPVPAKVPGLAKSYLAQPRG